MISQAHLSGVIWVHDIRYPPTERGSGSELCFPAVKTVFACWLCRENKIECLTFQSKHLERPGHTNTNQKSTSARSVDRNVMTACQRYRKSSDTGLVICSLLSPCFGVLRDFLHDGLCFLHVDPGSLCERFSGF